VHNGFSRVAAAILIREQTQKAPFTPSVSVPLCGIKVDAKKPAKKHLSNRAPNCQPQQNKHFVLNIGS
jgi:hypothetical protein